MCAALPAHRVEVEMSSRRRVQVAHHRRGGAKRRAARRRAAPSWKAGDAVAPTVEDHNTEHGLVLEVHAGRARFHHELRELHDGRKAPCRYRHQPRSASNNRRLAPLEKARRSWCFRALNNWSTFLGTVS